MLIAFMAVANFGAWAQDAGARISATQREEQVQKDDKELKLNETKVELILGEKFELKVVAEAPAAKVAKDAKPERVEWKSSNKEIVEVDEKGTIRGVKEGRATITAVSGGKEGKCDVFVISTLKREE